MNVSLTPELEKMVQAKVQSGRYNSANEVVQEALRLFEQHENLRAIHLGDLRTRIDEGLAALDRGEGVDGETFIQGMLDRLDAEAAKRDAG
jgi:antitoxin ParD1/3/4